MLHTDWVQSEKCSEMNQSDVGPENSMMRTWTCTNTSLDGSIAKLSTD